MGRGFGSPPGSADFQILAQAALARMPPQLARQLDGTVVLVEEFPDERTVESVGLDDPWLLTAIYHARPVIQNPVWDTVDIPPRIVLYRQPLLAEWCETGVSLIDLVNHVVVYEVGHHFGLTDRQITVFEQRAF